MRKHLKLGVFGFGCGGQGLYQLLSNTHGTIAEIKKICVHDPSKERSVDKSLFTYDKDEILNDPEIDVVVELINSADDAYHIVKEAMKKGKHVVTANKKMIAEHLSEIVEWQKKYNRSFLYEASVCGSIPIIRSLEEYYDNNLIGGVEGIFNGSTNYILTQVSEQGKTYQEALKLAQDLGFAESNPALDVKGFDPKFKLAIIVLHTYGVFLKPEQIVNIGIDKLNTLDLEYAQENNTVIKLVARVAKRNNSLFAFVTPQFIPQQHPFANVRSEYNAVLVDSTFSEKQLFVGKGAGSFPTGSAVLSDISALTYDYRYEYKKTHQPERYNFTNDLTVDVLVSFSKTNLVQESEFEKITHNFTKGNYFGLVGSVKLEKLRELYEKKEVSIVLLHEPNINISSEKIL